MLLLANGRSSDLSSPTRSSQTSANSCVLLSSDTIGRPKKGFTASGNVADLHCVPILAPFPHGIIYKGENQMRMQSYMFFLKEIQKEEKTAVFLLFFNTKWARSIIFVMIVWYLDAWEGRCYAFALFVPTRSAALGITFKASLMLCSHLHEQSGRTGNPRKLLKEGEYIHKSCDADPATIEHVVSMRARWSHAAHCFFFFSFQSMSSLCPHLSQNTWWRYTGWLHSGQCHSCTLFSVCLMSVLFIVCCVMFRGVL